MELFNGHELSVHICAYLHYSNDHNAELTSYSFRPLIEWSDKLDGGIQVRPPSHGCRIIIKLFWNSSPLASEVSSFFCVCVREMSPTKFNVAKSSFILQFMIMTTSFRILQPYAPTEIQHSKTGRNPNQPQ